MNKVKAYILLNIGFFIYSMNSIISKSNALKNELFSIDFFMYLSAQLGMLVLYTILWQISLKYIDLSIAYMFKSVTVIWTLLIAAFIFHEELTFYNWLGSLIIILGIKVVMIDDK